MNPSMRKLKRTNHLILFSLFCLQPLSSIAGSVNKQNDSGAYPIEVETAPRPEALARRTEEDIVIDGNLDEPAWAEAPAISDFIQSQPRVGYPATETTVVRVLYDRDNLYIGAVAYDSEPDRLVIPTLEQDFDSRGRHVHQPAGNGWQRRI